MRFLLLSLLLLPIIELFTLIEVGGQIGAFATIALVFLTALIGLSIIRRQGAATLLQAKSKMQQGSLPASEFIHTFLLGVAGVFLLFPGFLSDAIGILFLIPIFRSILISTVLLRILSKTISMKTSFSQSQQHAEGDIIEGEFVNEDRKLLDKKNSKN
ncbi:FxsA family protein [Marinomonas agarivorans]|nr:FxsA family protein [Marinomonas agarivorans]